MCFKTGCTYKVVDKINFVGGNWAYQYLLERFNGVFTVERIEVDTGVAYIKSNDMFEYSLMPEDLIYLELVD